MCVYICSVVLPIFEQARNSNNQMIGTSCATIATKRGKSEVNRSIRKKYVQTLKLTKNRVKD